MEHRHLAPTIFFREYYHAELGINRLSNRLYSTLLPKQEIYDLVFVCIGTDRSTGDALGPLIGSKLEKYNLKNASIYGTLDQPIHALNLAETMDEIKRKHPQPFIIAIDACLGELKNVGLVTFGEGSLKPGAGVNKKLPEIGHVYLTGIVNVGGFMEYFVLQNTRLSLVMNMAEMIASAIFFSDIQLAKQKEAPKRRHFLFGR